MKKEEILEVKIERAASLETNDAALKRIATFLLQYGAEKGTIKIRSLMQILTTRLHHYIHTIVNMMITQQSIAATHNSIMFMDIIFHCYLPHFVV